jgi:hypothetical protein
MGALTIRQYDFRAGKWQRHPIKGTSLYTSPARRAGRVENAFTFNDLTPPL